MSNDFKIEPKMAFIFRYLAAHPSWCYADMMTLLRHPVCGSRGFPDLFFVESGPFEIIERPAEFDEDLEYPSSGSVPPGRRRLD